MKMSRPLCEPVPPFLRSALDGLPSVPLSAAGVPDLAGFRTVLKAVDRASAQAFFAGEDVTLLVKGRALAVDCLLKFAWRAFELDTRANTTAHSALIAVGGYGRAELHPYSDIDLLILLEASPDAGLEAALSAFITFVWDLGLAAGTSVRTLEDCVGEGRQDITVITNLMEARLLAGTQPLYHKMLAQTGPAHLWPSAAFFSAKLAEQEQRRRKFGDTAYKLEPNVKEGPGGLRDIQMIGWVTKRHLGASQLHELVDHHFLTEDEYCALMRGQTFLWRVRFALHLLANRREDRLLFDHQHALAELFGYAQDHPNATVEAFMQVYFRTVMELERLNEMLLQLYDEAILQAPETALPVPINRRFQARQGYLEVTQKNVFLRYPPALLELFLILEQRPELKGVRATTIRLLRDHRYLIDAHFRQNLINRSLFMEILRQPQGVTRALKRMSRYGILAAYWPSFAQAAGRMQYDLFHVYTVDEHTLFVLRNVRRFAYAQYAHELPFCHQLFKRIPKPELLYLAALFHDIGKGHGGDHSEIGATETERFCLEHGLSPYDAALVSWLVRHHLLMSFIAQHRDLSDPEEINAFAAKVGNTIRLNYLYLLTVADIRGTNPELWNSWKEALLTELYYATFKVLQRGLDNPLAREELIAQTKALALATLKGWGFAESAILARWQHLGDDYFLRHSGDEVVWHTQGLLESTPEDLPLILIRELTERGATEIFVYLPDHPYLFAHIAASLTQLGLDVLGARITTALNGFALDSFQVLGQNGQPVTNAFDLAEVTTRLRTQLKHPQAVPAKLTRAIPRRLRHFSVPTQITLTTAPDALYTRLDIITTDYPGLLAGIGQAFIDGQVLVHTALINTIGAQAQDVFFITDLSQRPITDPKAQEGLRQGLLEHLDMLTERKGERLA